MAAAFSGVILRMAVDSKAFRSGLNDAQKNLQSFSAGMNVLGFRLGAIFAATFGAISAFAIKVGVDFELAFAGVRKTVDLSEKGFAQLEASLLSASKATGIAASELADLTRIGGQLGVTGAKNLAKFTDTIAKLSIAAAELTPEAAARGLARLITLTGEGIGTVDKLASTLAFLGDKLPTTEERILNFSVLLAGMAKTASLSSEQVLGIAAGFSALVPGTERASTAVQRLIQTIIVATAEGGSKLEELGKITEQSGEQFKQSFEKDGAEAIATILDGFSRLKTQGSDRLLSSLKILGLQNIRTTQTLLAGAGGAKLFRKAIFAATQDTDRFLKLEKEFAVQLATVSKQFDRLKRAVESVGIQLFKAFRDQILLIIAAGIKLAGMLEKVAIFFQKLPASVKIAAIGFVALAGAVSLAAIAIGTLGGAFVSGLATIGQLTSGVKNLIVALKSGTLSTFAFGTSSKQLALPLGDVVGKSGKLSGSIKNLIPLLGKLGPALGGVAKLGTAVGAGILVGAAAADFFGERLKQLGINQGDATKKAIQELGIFTKAWEGTKVIVVTVLEGIGTALSAGASALASFGGAILEVPISLFTRAFELLGGTAVPILDQIAVALDVAQDAGTTAAEELFRLLGRFPPVIQEVTAAQMFWAKEFGVTITAMDDAASVARKLVLAQQEQKRAFEESPEGIAIATAAIFDLNLENKELIKVMLAAKQETAKNAEAARFLGKSADELKVLIKDQGEGFVDLVLKIKEDTKAKEKNVDVTKGLIKSQADFKTEASNLNAAIVEQGGAANILASEVERLAPRLIELRVATGELKGESEELIKRWREMKAAAASITGEMKSIADTAADLEQIVKDAGGAFELNNKFLEESAKAFIELANSGQTLTSTMIEVIARWEDLTIAEQENIRVAELAKKAQEELAESIDKLLQDAGVNTDKATQEFEKFKETIKGALDQVPIEKFDEFAKKAEELGQAFIEEFPAATEEMKAFFLQLGIQFKESKKESDDFSGALRDVKNIMQVLGISADSTFGKVIGGIAAARKAAADIAKSGGILKGILGEKGIGGLLSGEGIAAGISFATDFAQGAAAFMSASGAGGLAGVLGGAVAGAEIGGSLGELIGGPAGKAIGAAIGAGVGAAVGILRSIFGQPEFKKIAEDVGKRFGVDISDELAKQIEKTADELNLSRFEASLLNLGDIIAEAGGIIEFGVEKAAQAIGNLFNALESGAIPAEQAIEQIGSAFQDLVDETFKAGTTASSEIAALVARSKELGQEIPEITNFIVSQLEQAAAGVAAIIGTMQEIDGEKVFGGIQVTSAEDAQAQATIFASAFFATLETQGLIAAIDTFGPVFKELKAKFAEFGAEVDFGGVQKFFKLAEDPTFRPLLEGIQGLKDAMTGLGNAGFLTAESFSAFQQQGAAAFEQLTEAGLKPKQALQQIAPFLQEAINLSQQFGFAIDEDTQKLIDEAEAAGIAFSTDPMVQVVEVLKLIAQELGVTADALNEVGAAGSGAGTEISNSFDQAAADAAITAGDAESLWALAFAGIDASIQLTDEQQEMLREDMSQTLADILSGAISAAEGFALIAEEARKAAEAANTIPSPGGGGGGGGGGNAGQFGLTRTVNEPTTFSAGEAGTETVEITPGGGRGGAGAGAVGGPVILQIDGKVLGKILGDLSRTGDVRIHPSAVREFG